MDSEVDEEKREGEKEITKESETTEEGATAEDIIIITDSENEGYQSRKNTLRRGI